MIKLYHLILFSFLLLLSCPTYSQQYNFEIINQEKGFPSSSVNKIFKGSNGLLWYGTNGSGLIRYDGNSFVTYNKYKELENFFIIDIIERNDELILLTKYKGLLVFNGKEFIKNKEYLYVNGSIDNLKKIVRTDSKVYGISLNRIYTIDDKSKLHPLLSIEGTNIKKINTISKLDNNSFLVATDKGLYQFSNNTFHLVDFQGKDVTITEDRKTFNYLGDEKGNVYILHFDNGKYVYNRLITTVKDNKNNPLHINNIYKTDSGNIWVSGNNFEGVGIVYKNGSYTIIDNQNGFPNTEINTIFMENSSLSLGSTSLGVVQFSNQTFVKYHNYPQLSTKSIFAVAEQNDKLFVYSRDYGLNVFQKEGFYNLKFLKKVDFNLSVSILLNNGDELLIGSSKGLYSYKDNLVRKIFPNIMVSSLMIDDANRIWITTISDGLFILDSNYNVINHFFKNDKVNTAYNVQQVSKKEWFVATGLGLYTIQLEEGIFKVKNKLLKKLLFLSTKDDHNTVWYAGENKIYSINKDKKIKVFGTDDGLSSTLIYTFSSINESLLVGSNLGLDRITPDSEGNIINVESLSSSNMFDGIETNTKSDYVDNQGNIYFGTVKGLYKYYYKNQSLHAIKKNAPIFITKLQVNNKEYKSNVNNKYFDLPNENHQFNHDENSLTFQIGQINNSLAENNYYSFKLKGLNDYWTKPTTNKDVNYYNLPPGKYKFYVKEVDPLGNDLGKVSYYPFEIRAPFYTSWWFVLLICTLTILAFNYLVRNSSRYNKDFVKNISESELQSDLKIYFLYFGIIIITTQIAYFVFEIYNENEVITKIILGFCSIFLYLFSYISRIRNNIEHIFRVFLL